jgi:hypothetical protein
MDPFVVVSCGRKVFRTRVIRHNLNPTWDEKLFFHVRRTEAQWVVAFGVYDWDKLSANDHVGDVSVPLEQLLGTTIQPDERGLYPVDAEGKLVGDDFHDHSLSIQVVGTSPGESPTLQIRAKYTPYGEFRPLPFEVETHCPSRCPPSTTLASVPQAVRHRRVGRLLPPRDLFHARLSRINPLQGDHLVLLHSIRQVGRPGVDRRRGRALPRA